MRQDAREIAGIGVGDEMDSLCCVRMAPQRLHQHARAVLQHAHLGSGLIRPVDRNLDDPVPAAPGEQEQLHVEAEPLGTEGPEERVRHGPAEQLEPALGIHHARHAEGADEAAPHLARQLPVRPGPHHHGRIGQGARAHRQISPGLDGGFQPLDLHDGRGPIGVRHEPERAARDRHPRAHRAPLPAVLGQRMQPHGRVETGQLAHTVRGGIAAAVIHHHDLVGLVAAIEVRHDLLEIGGQAHRLVVGRDDH